MTRETLVSLPGNANHLQTKITKLHFSQNITLMVDIEPSGDSGPSKESCSWR